MHRRYDDYYGRSRSPPRHSRAHCPWRQVRSRSTGDFYYYHEASGITRLTPPSCRCYEEIDELEIHYLRPRRLMLSDDVPGTPRGLRNSNSTSRGAVELNDTEPTSDTTGPTTAPAIQQQLVEVLTGLTGLLQQTLQQQQRAASSRADGSAD